MVNTNLDLEPDSDSIQRDDLFFLTSSMMGLETKISEFAQRKSRIAVIIPIWNQGNAILDQLRRMQDTNLSLDVVLCDSNSSDGSTLLCRLKRLGVRTLLTTEHVGLGTALRLGFCYAMDQGYEGVIAIDGNGKDGVEAITVFEECLFSGFDLVQGSRFMTGGRHSNTPWEHYLGIRCFIAPAMRMAAGFQYTDPTNGFKGLSRRFLLDDSVQPFRPVFQQFNLQFYLNYIAPRLGFRITEIPVSRVYPKGVPTPTKIIGIQAKWRLLRQFFGVIFGRYNLPNGRRDG